MRKLRLAQHRTVIRPAQAARSTQARRLCGLAGAFALAAACSEPQAPPPPPPPAVVVAQPVRRTVTLYEYATGTTRATESVEVRARVSGELREMHFEPSHQVKKGDLLFLIEPEGYQAARNEAFAAVESAKAQLLRAESDLKRAKEAAASNAIAEADLDLAKANRDMAEAGVLSAKAILEGAELELSYTRVTAPIQGQVGRNQIDVGNVVSGTQGTLLTTINKLRPLFVYFDAPEKSVIVRLRELSDAQTTFEERDRDLGRQEVHVGTLADGEEFPYRGKLDFASNTVTTDTGTLELRGVLPNEDLRLFPGLFVRVRLPAGELDNAVLVDERAIGADLGGKYVYLIGEGNVVEQRYVELGLVEADKMVPVLEGLDGSETYIVEGLLKARPGLPVTPQSAPTARASGAPSPGAQAPKSESAD